MTMCVTRRYLGVHLGAALSVGRAPVVPQHHRRLGHVGGARLVTCASGLGGFGGHAGVYKGVGEFVEDGREAGSI